MLGLHRAPRASFEIGQKFLFEGRQSHDAEGFPGLGLLFATSINHKECKRFELKTQ